MVPVSRDDADNCVKRWHYSGKTYPKSQLNLGVFLDEKLLGAMQFGPSLDKRNLIHLVRDTTWSGFLELNRMAFSDALPRNSESRALSVALRMIKKRAPHVQWIVSFSDATRCGDGAIYRATGFLLTGITKNKTLLIAPDGAVVSDVGVRTSSKMLSRYKTDGSWRDMKRLGFKRIEGYQLRYLYPLQSGVRERLTIPLIPYSEIPLSVKMVRGVRVGSVDGDAFSSQEKEEGSNPIPTL